MATIDVGDAHGARRTLTHEVPLIPFIDFLLCLIAFLLVTAVWSQMARLNADAQAPGPTGENPDVVRELHVEASTPNQFKLAWRENGTVINTVTVPRRRVALGNEGDFQYPDLSAKVTSEWRINGQHRADSDPKLDRAVLHVDNSLPFEDIAAIIDSLHATQRKFTQAGKTVEMSAFSVAFAVN